MSTPSTPDPSPPPPRRSNYGWAFYFAFLLIASIAVTGIMIWFNLSIQLKPEQLEAAAALWKEKGPKNYNMLMQKRIGNSATEDRFAIKVRAGKVVEVRMNDELLKPTIEDGKVQDPRIYHSMEIIFRDIQRFMDLDQKAGAKKVYVVANFDGQTGAVQRYIRRVMGSTERVEMNIKLEAVEE